MYRFIKKKKRPQIFALNKLADEMTRAIHISLVKGIRAVKSETQIKNIVDKLSKNDIEGAINAVRWDTLEKEVEKIRNIYYEGANKSAEKYKEYLPKVIKPELKYDTESGRLKKLLDTRYNYILLDLSTSSKEAVRRQIESSLARGIPVKKIARIIESSIGLHDRYALATSRYHELLLKEGIAADEAEVRMLRYADRLLSARANAIARTESAFIINAGEREVIFQAIDKDLIEEKSTMKTWIVDPATVCDICEELDGETIELHDVFHTPFGIVDIPPLHPNCNCLVDYKFEIK